MYAVIKTGGKQYKVSPGEVLRVEKIQAAVGAEIELPDVLLVTNEDGQVQVGTPTLENATVRAQVLEHDRARKVIVFKKKRRKGYKVKRGHRQPYTTLEIKEIRT
jgi:large subunit ribosomal protein L21